MKILSLFLISVLTILLAQQALAAPRLYVIANCTGSNCNYKTCYGNETFRGSEIRLVNPAINLKPKAGIGAKQGSCDVIIERVGDVRLRIKQTGCQQFHQAFLNTNFTITNWDSQNQIRVFASFANPEVNENNLCHINGTRVK